ncbi:MAG TPA: MarR family transcriptional regulator [Burkholderiaceae bacterium]
MSTVPTRKTARPEAGARTGAGPGASVHEGKALAALQKLREIIKTAQEQFQSTSQRDSISGSQAWALSEIARHPGVIVSELGKIMAIHPSTTSNMLDKMQKRGLIRRERIDSDQRVVRLFVTERGESMLGDLPGPGRGLLPDALASLGSDELDHVDKALALILGKLERRTASAPPVTMIGRPSKGGARARRGRQTTA